MAIIWALLSALSYGIADLCGREASQEEGTLKTLLYLQLIGTPLALFSLLFSHPVSWLLLFSWAGLLLILIALMSMTSAWLLYRSMVIGPLLIVSPITSCFAAVAVVLSLLSGEQLTILQFSGLLLVTVGIMLAISAPNDVLAPINLQDYRGIYYAIAAALILGVEFWVLRFVIPVFGEQLIVVVLRLISIVLLTGLFLARGLTMKLTSNRSWRWLLPLGVLDTAAISFYMLGINSGLTSVVAVITSLYSVVTIILGYLFWHERITYLQQFGISIIFVGIALLAAMS